MLSPQAPGRRRAEAAVPPAPAMTAASFPADLAELEARHGARWLIEDVMDGYQARRWIDEGAADEPAIAQFRVWHATARGLDAALTALGDLR
ncbi:MAG: hypothetical protein ACLQFR_29965 [Streptosporangiaceae bacterium]